MAIRRRAPQEFEATESKFGPQTVTIQGMVGGYNGYTSPELLSPQFWAGASNLYAGQFGTIRRARMAPILNSSTSGYAPSGTPLASLFGFYAPGSIPVLFFDDSTATLNMGYTQMTSNGVQYPGFLLTLNSAFLVGPYMNLAPNPGMILRANGLARVKYYIPANIANYKLEFLGLDAPDSSTQITQLASTTSTISTAVRTSNIVTITTSAAHNILAGYYVNIAGVTDTTFNSPTGVAYLVLTVPDATHFTFAQIGSNASSGSGTADFSMTKTVGKSYEWTWENANTGHIGPPSPASQYVIYSGKYGKIDLVQPGTVAGTIATNTLVGTNTLFTAAWIGRSIWVESVGSVGPITAVADSTHATVGSFAGTFTGKQFQVYDQQSTNIRLYGTGDGGAVYFRIARNAFNPASTTLAGSGLEFIDTGNYEPPNAPFTSELAQNFNVPPPIGTYLDQYQGRVVLYGVPGALQSFFYSNIETTIFGQPPESFAPLNQVTLPIADGQLFGTANLPTGFILWSNKQDMFKITGLLTDNTVSNQYQLGATLQRLPYRIGSGSPYATSVTSLGAFWLSSDREVWLFTDHYAPKNVGKPIQDILNRINGARLGFARMKNYKRGERNWLALAIALDSSTTNNKLCLLDLDLLASNGQPSFFTFDMATNQPTWYLYDVNCESIEAAFDAVSQNHMLVGYTDLITDVDWQPGYYTITTETNSIPNGVTLHALGNENPSIVKSMDWMRANTNQIPKNLASQGWQFKVLTYDDDTTVLGAANTGNVVTLIPGVNSQNPAIALENSAAVFRLGAVQSVKGRRFQIGATLPTIPGLWELRGFQIRYTNIYER
jgi:hypothetical protein